MSAPGAAASQRPGAASSPGRPASPGCPTAPARAAAPATPVAVGERWGFGGHAGAPSYLTIIEVVAARQLFVSLASATLAAESAQASRK